PCITSLASHDGNLPRLRCRSRRADCLSRPGGGPGGSGRPTALATVDHLRRRHRGADPAHRRIAADPSGAGSGAIHPRSGPGTRRALSDWAWRERLAEKGRNDTDPAQREALFLAGPDGWLVQPQGHSVLSRLSTHLYLAEAAPRHSGDSADRHLDKHRPQHSAGLQPAVPASERQPKRRTDAAYPAQPVLAGPRIGLMRLRYCQPYELSGLVQY